MQQPEMKKFYWIKSKIKLLILKPSKQSQRNYLLILRYQSFLLLLILLLLATSLVLKRFLGVILRA